MFYLLGSVSRYCSTQFPVPIIHRNLFHFCSCSHFCFMFWRPQVWIWAKPYSDWGFLWLFWISSGTYCNTVQPLSIFSLCIAFPQVLSISLVPVNRPHKQYIIKSDSSFLKVSFSYVSRSECLALTHSICRMIVSEKKE